MPNVRKNAHLYLLGLVVLFLGAVALFYSNARDAVPGIPSEKYEDMPAGNGEPQEPSGVPDTPLACAEAGGVWNDCASACPDAEPDEVCIQLCVERCEGLGLDATIPVYFSNTALSSNENPECDEVFPVPRELSRRKARPGNWPLEALKSLLEGTTEAEEAAGFFTSIPEGVRLTDYYPEDGTVSFALTEELDQAAGSCRVIAIRAQIERTLTQFPDIDEVVIFVEGKTPEESLQP